MDVFLLMGCDTHNQVDARIAQVVHHEADNDDSGIIHGRHDYVRFLKLDEAQGADVIHVEEHALSGEAVFKGVHGRRRFLSGFFVLPETVQTSDST